MNARFNEIYADSSRDSIAPEKLIRALLLQVFYSVRSERQICEQLRYNLLFRWFVGLALDDAVWGRFGLLQESGSVAGTPDHGRLLWPGDQPGRCTRLALEEFLGRRHVDPGVGQSKSFGRRMGATIKRLAVKDATRKPTGKGSRDRIEPTRARRIRMRAIIGRAITLRPFFAIKAMR